MHKSIFLLKRRESHETGKHMERPVNDSLVVQVKQAYCYFGRVESVRERRVNIN